jgi:hypothetical protein
MRDLDPSQYGEADRRQVDPPVAVESATWSTGGQLDWWVKERQKWLGRVRGPEKLPTVSPLLSDCWQLETQPLFGRSGS